MKRNLSRIAAAAFNDPLLLEPAYARVFFSALGREIGAISVADPQKDVVLDAAQMEHETEEYRAGGKREARFYHVVNGIAVLPVTGALVHRLGCMRPFSGMTGYDGITHCLQDAMSDPGVRGVLLDFDSPGGQAAGAFDCADIIYRLRDQKPIWALCNDMACSAAMLLASACSHRLITQTSRIGSIGVMMAHANFAGHLKQEGVDITLIYSGSHKVDGNQFKRLPEPVRADFQARIDAARLMFAEKVSTYTGLSVEAVLGTEAAVYDGQEGIDIGLADQMVIAADAIQVMSAAINNTQTGDVMSVLTATEAAAAENSRVMGILNCPEAKGREAQAQALAGCPGMSVDQAKTILAAAPQIATETTTTTTTEAATSEADRIMSCEAAKGREKLATALAGTAGMTLAQALPILSASPQETSLSSQIMALPEAKGREALAGKLAEQAGMTVETAKELLAAAPAQAGMGSGASAFEQFMSANSPAAVTTGSQATENPEEALLMSIPGTPSAQVGKA